MTRLKSILGYSGAILTVVCAAIAPFLLFGWFTHAIGAAGLRIHPTFSGGDVSHTIERPGYRIVVHKRVGRTSPWQRVGPFVQLVWTPGARLPATVSDEVDLDGDGQPDVRVSFQPAALVLDAVPLHPWCRPVHSRGVTSFGELIARVNGDIVVRLPVD